MQMKDNSLVEKSMGDCRLTNQERNSRQGIIVHMKSHA